MKSHCTTVLMIALLAPIAHADDKATKKGKAITNSIPREEVREWTSGQYKVLASIVSTSGEGDQLTVSLKKADGSIAHVKANVLSMPDSHLSEFTHPQIRVGLSNRRELALRPIAFGVAAMYAEPDSNRIQACSPLGPKLHSSVRENGRIIVGLARLHSAISRSMFALGPVSSGDSHEYFG